ncbi:hypothetical protein AGOR_G00168550 [Albula goreensis]|uniref:CENP-T/Histone H4 histone fold domain-containing protein n=1 Tax=Albula goreensis TaxID=1534307 RepID=A0A8T3D5M7_9TELE|nr:hypothetical protein AGOR_G00168550 [Albula goreensis]
MDLSDEDVSARVLLRNVLSTELPSLPVTRSTSRLQHISTGPRRSSRLRKSDAGLLSPQVALRQKLRQNLHESISNRSPVQQRKRSLSTLIKKVNTPAVMSFHSLTEDDVTPRGLLRGVLQTEPEQSLLLLPERNAAEEAGLCSRDSSLSSIGNSMANLELPDLPTVNLTMAVRGISRKRPKRNMNVSVFERKIIDHSGDATGDLERDMTVDLSTMSGASASYMNLSLKTPHVDLRKDRFVLQRRAGKRKAISVEDFEEGVHNLLARKRVPSAVWEKSVSEMGEQSNMDTWTDNTRGLQEESEREEEERAGVDEEPAAVDGMLEPDAEVEEELGATESETQEEEMTSEEPVRMAEHMSQRAYRSEGVMKIPGVVAGGRGYKSLSGGLQVEDTESEGDAGLVESQEEEMTSEEPERVVEHISRRAYRSEGVMKIPGVVAGGRGYKSLSGGLQVEDTESKSDGGLVESKEEEMTPEEPEQVVEHISQRAHRSEGVMKIPGMEAGGRGYKSLSGGLQVEDTDREQSVSEARGQSNMDTWTEHTEGLQVAQEETKPDAEEEPMERLELNEDGGATESETQEEEMTSEEPVRVAEHISQRANLSEGVMKIPGMEAGGRGYKSLSGGLQVEDTEEAKVDAELVESQEEEMTSEEPVRVAEHISKRAHRSEGVMKIPGMEAGGRGYKSLLGGLQLEGTESEGDTGGVESGGPSGTRASSEWFSGPEEVGDPSSHSPPAPSAPSSPNEIPPTLEPIYSSKGRSLWEEEEEEEEGHTSGADSINEVEDKENSVPLLEQGSPEMSPLPQQTPHISIQAQDEGQQEYSEEEEDNEDDEEDQHDDSQSEELSMETPAFIRERKRVQTPGPVATPNFLKDMMEARRPPQDAPAAKPKPKRKPRAAPSQQSKGLPKSYIMSTFKHFAKTAVSSDTYPVLKDIMDKYFDRLADDLEAYATHANRKTIEVEDVELLMRRQGFVTDSMPVDVLIEKYLPREYRTLLKPMATSGNKVIPKQRR